jgi:hypothetical protein
LLRQIVVLRTLSLSPVCPISLHWLFLVFFSSPFVSRTAERRTSCCGCFRSL